MVLLNTTAKKGCWSSLNTPGRLAAGRSIVVLLIRSDQFTAMVDDDIRTVLGCSQTFSSH
jgi:hypothetical protein